MVTKTLNIDLDIENILINNCSFELVQNDISVYTFNITMYNDGEALDLSSVSYATITFKKSDGTAVVGTASITSPSNGTISYTLGTSELSCSGSVYVTVELIGSSGERLTSNQFHFFVRAELDDGSGVTSTTEYPVLVDLIERVSNINDVMIYPEQYGAVGDGITNDASALQLAFNAGNNIYISQTYLCETDIILPDGVSLYGSNSGKIYLNSTLTCNGNNTIDGIIFDTQNLNDLPIKISGNNVNFTNNKLLNVKGQLLTSQAKGIVIDNDMSNILIKNNEFNTFTPFLDNGIVDDNGGVIRAIYCEENLTNCIISDNVFKGMYGTDDGDYIHIQSSTTPTVDTDIFVSGYYFNESDVKVLNNVFYDVKRSAVKIQASNVLVDGNKIYGTIGSTSSNFSGIRAYSSKNCTINNNTIDFTNSSVEYALIVSSTEGFEVSNNTIIVDNPALTSTTRIFNFLNSRSINIENNIFRMIGTDTCIGYFNNTIDENFNNNICDMFTISISEVENLNILNNSFIGFIYEILTFNSGVNQTNVSITDNYVESTNYFIRTSTTGTFTNLNINNNKLNFTNDGLIVNVRNSSQNINELNSNNNTFINDNVIVNVKDYGAVGNLSTDDTTSINNAISKINSIGYGTLIFNYSSGYKVTSALTAINHNINVIMESDVLYVGNSNITILTIGNSSNRSEDCYYKLRVKRNTQSDWLSESNIGIKLINFYRCKIDLVKSQGFTIGAKLLGSTSIGFVYNNFNLGYIYNNKIGIDLDNESSGWCNENEFHSGNFGVATGVNNGISRYGVRITSQSSSYNNNNVFYKPSFELNAASATGTGIYAIGILQEYAQYNYFYDIRSEGNDYIYQNDNNSYEPIVSIGYGTKAYINNNTTISMENIKERSGERILTENLKLVKSFNDLKNNTNCYNSSGDIAINGLDIISSSGTVSTAQSSILIKDSYIEVPLTRGLMINIDTTLSKRFVVTRNTLSGFNGRIRVNCFDANGNRLTSSGSGHPYVKINPSSTFSYSTAFGGGYVNGSDLTDDNTDKYFMVGSDVKYIQLVLHGGTNVLKIKGFSIFTLDRYTPITWTNHEEVSYNSSLISSTPCIGTYEVGKLLYYINPASSGFLNEVCTTAGTLGILSGVTGSITSGTTPLTVNDSSNLLVGQYINISGVSGVKKITAISGNVVSINSTSNSSVSNASISYYPAVFKKCGNIKNDYEIYPEWFGAVGDGSTDDSAAINDAISAATNGTVIRFSNKIYAVSSPITINKHGIKLSGVCMGWDSDFCTIKATSSFSGESVIVFRHSSVSYIRSIGMENITIDGGTTCTSHGILMQRAYDGCKFENVHVKNIADSKHSWYHTTNVIGDIGQTCTFINCTGLHRNNTSTAPTWKIDYLQESVFINCKSWAGAGSTYSSSATCFDVCGSGGLQFIGCSAVYTKGHGWLIDPDIVSGANGISLISCLFEECKYPYGFTSNSYALFGTMSSTPTLYSTITNGSSTPNGVVSFANSSGVYVYNTNGTFSVGDTLYSGATSHGTITSIRKSTVDGFRVLNPQIKGTSAKPFNINIQDTRNATVDIMKSVNETYTISVTPTAISTNINTSYDLDIYDYSTTTNINRQGYQKIFYINNIGGASYTLPMRAYVGMEVTIVKNDSTSQYIVYPASGDTIESYSRMYIHGNSTVEQSTVTLICDVNYTWKIKSYSGIIQLANGAYDRQSYRCTKTSVYNTTSNLTLGTQYGGMTITNKGATGTVNVTLTQSTVMRGAIHKFVKVANQPFRITPKDLGGGNYDTIRGATAGEYLELTNVGDSVTLQCTEVSGTSSSTDTGVWDIIASKGSYTFQTSSTTSKFGDVTGGNYSEFEADGTYVAHGNAITWRDEYVGGEWFVPTGASAPDIVDYTIGGVVTRKYSFDGSTTIEKIGNTFEIPHDMAVTPVNNGTLDLEFHLHIAPSTNSAASSCVFVVDWCYIPVNGLPIAGTQLTLTKSFSANTQYCNCLVDGHFSVPSGGFGIGGLIEFTVSRTPSNASDTYTSDVILYKAAMHVPCDTLGSREEYVK